MSAGLLLCLHAALAQGTETAPVAPARKPVPTLEKVQVSASRMPEPASAVPASVSVRELSAPGPDGPRVNLSEALHGIPGLLARERQNLAQDLQLSIRGFGSRSTFGIRGLRLYLDGIPASLPDGQGQVSNIALGATGRIEVLRGPYSVLYGNAAGGVIQVFSADGADEPGLRSSAAAGSNGLRRLGLNLRGAQAPFDYHLDLARTEVDGYRRHSRARRESFNLKLRFEADPGRRLTLLANALEQPFAQDPLGLTREQARDDPRQAVPAALAFDTRKSVDHRQAGLLWEQEGVAQDLRLLAYGGRREVLQFLAVPVAAQANPLSGGGVVDLSSRFSGAEVRWTARGHFAGRPLDLVLGTSFDQQDQHRRGHENFIGPRLGVIGRLRRDQLDRVSALGQYAQLNWQASARLGLRLAMRHSLVRFDSNDRYIAAGNPDDSGRREFSALSPVASIEFRPDDRNYFYASYGAGFETPTFDELGYRPDGSAGLNFALEEVNTRSLEIGAKGRVGGDWRWQAALFRADSDDELAVTANSGGRASYANVGPARRQGLELAIQWDDGGRWRHELAYTYLDARYRKSFLTCAGGPCANPALFVPAGTPVPGTARSQLAIAARWTGGRGWDASVEAEAVGSVRANTAGDQRAPGYAVLDATLGRAWQAGRRAFLRVDNLLDRRYIGSVIVNESNGRHYEPAPGRSLVLGLDWRW